MSDILLKAFTCNVKTVDEDERVYDLMPSTETTDRDGDVLRATGARLDSYRKNPVVLWAHDHRQLPVAKALAIEAVESRGLKARIQFAPPGVSAHADAVSALWKGGFLNAASVGFIPLQHEKNASGKGLTFTDWELLEFSIVPVPANADALRLGLKALAVSGASTAEIVKRGRVLSAANEARLRTASDSIIEVLAQLGGAGDAEDDSAGKSTTENVELTRMLNEIQNLIREF